MTENLVYETNGAIIVLNLEVSLTWKRQIMNTP